MISIGRPWMFKNICITVGSKKITGVLATLDHVQWYGT